MPDLHLITGPEEGRRAQVRDQLVAISGGRPVVVLEPWAPDAPVPAEPALASISRFAEVLLLALDLPAPVLAEIADDLVPTDLAVLVGLARRVQEERAEQRSVIVELPAHGDPSRLLTAPARWARRLRALVPVLGRWGVLVSPPGLGQLPHPEPEQLAALGELAGLLEDLDARLADPATGIHHVPGPGPAARAGTARLEVALALMGRTVTQVHDGPAALPVPSVASPEPVARVRPEEGAFVYEIDVPGLRAGDLSLVRHEDELVLSCAGQTRAVLLPSVLRRCLVERAGVRDGVLTLRMTPDEGVWPRG